MAKVTIKGLQEEVKIKQQINEKLAGQLVKAEDNVAKSNAHCQELHREIEVKDRTINHTNILMARGEARFQELLVAYDILLRTKMRAEGISWEEIERIITEARKNIGCGHDHHNNGGGGGVDGFRDGFRIGR